MYPHRIRLRGPWDYEPLARRSDDPRPLPPAGRMTLPTPWAAAGLSEFAGRLQLRRSFGYPGQIDPHEQVWLTFGSLRDHAEILLNGSRLGTLTAEGGEFLITPLLRPRNELLVVVDGDHNGGLIGDVALEVRAEAFLRDVCLRREGSSLVATGRVVGRAPAPLDLYLVLDRWTAEHAVIVPTPDGQPFQLRGDAVNPHGQPVRLAKVDLVYAAVRWYTVEQILLDDPEPVV